MTPKYPEIEVKLLGENGNAFEIVGRVAKALRQNGKASEVSEYMTEATENDYDHLLRTTMRWVTVT